MLVAALNAVLTEAKRVVSVDIEEDVMELVRGRFIVVSNIYIYIYMCVCRCVCVCV